MHASNKCRMGLCCPFNTAAKVHGKFPMQNYTCSTTINRGAARSRRMKCFSFIHFWCRTFWIKTQLSKGSDSLAFPFTSSQTTLATKDCYKPGPAQTKGIKLTLQEKAITNLKQSSHYWNAPTCSLILLKTKWIHFIHNSLRAWRSDRRCF